MSEATYIYGKPFYYLLGNVYILFISKISYKVYKISNISDILYTLLDILYDILDNSIRYLI